jgi:putative transposase
VLIVEYKLRVNPAQQSAIDEAIRTVQVIRNKCLRKWMDERGVGDNDLQVHCAALAKDYPFAACLNSQARQVGADRAWLSIARFYKNCRAKKPGKKGYPRFQHANRSVEYKTTGWHLEPDGKQITFRDGTGMGTLRMIGTNPERKKTRSIATFPLAQITRVRLLHRADGYYIQFAVKAERTLPHAPTGKPIGIDVGLKALYTDSDGNKVANPRYLRKAEQKLKRLHRRVSRKSKHSKNRKKAIHQLARGYLKVQRQRKDPAVKAARALVQSHGLVAFEDLKITYLLKNHRLAKSISDASWGLLLAWVRSYGALHSIPVVGCFAPVHHPGLQRLRVPGEEKPVGAHPYLPSLWSDAGPGRGCRAEHLGGGTANGRHLQPYRRAGGNGHPRGCERFWTDCHYGCVRKGTSQAGWLKEESPAFQAVRVSKDHHKERSSSHKRITPCCWPSYGRTFSF